MKTPELITTLQEKTGKKISRILFRTFTNQEGVTKEFNPKAWASNKKKSKDKPYVLPIVNHYFQIWEEGNLIERSKPLRECTHLLSEELVKTLRYLPKDYSLSMLGLEPVYLYCKEKGIEFTDKEKRFLRWKLETPEVRKEILDESPDSDVMIAVLKYYIKNTALLYFHFLRELEENPEKYAKERQIAEEKNNPKDDIGKEMKKTAEKILDDLDKRFGLKSKKHKIEFTTVQIIASNLPKIPSSELFKGYLNMLEDDRDLIVSIDKKILSALDLYPDLSQRRKAELKDKMKKMIDDKRHPQDLPKRYDAPTETNTILANSRGDLYTLLYKSLINRKRQVIL